MVVTLYFLHSAAAAPLYIEAVPSMSRSLKTSFCSVHGQKFQVSQRLCVLHWPAQQSHWLLKASHWRCWRIPTAVWHRPWTCHSFYLTPKGLALGDTVKAMSNYHIIIVIIQIKVVITIHQINGQTAHNTCEEEGEDKSRRDVAKTQSSFSPALTSFHSKTASGKGRCSDLYQKLYLSAVKLMH